MNKCKVCGKDCGKGKTCGNTCRSKLRRATVDATLADVPIPDDGYTQPDHHDTTDSNGRIMGGLPANFGQPDCECMHCQTNRANGSKHVINHGAYKTADQLTKTELNQVSLPGDVDYVVAAPIGACLIGK